MKGILILDCCSYEVKTCSKTYKYIDCYKLKSGEKFFKKKLSDGREIKKELLLVGYCPNCKHWVIRFLFYAKATGRFQDWDETKIVRGKKADEIFNRRSDSYNLIDLPDPFKPKLEGKHSKRIPWVYYKAIDDYSHHSFLSFEGDLRLFGKLKMSYITSMLIIFAFEDLILM